MRVIQPKLRFIFPLEPAGEQVAVGKLQDGAAVGVLTLEWEHDLLLHNGFGGLSVLCPPAENTKQQGAENC
jgi:hypothetical protein